MKKDRQKIILSIEFSYIYDIINLFKLHDQIEIVFGGLNNECEFVDRKRIYK